MRPWIVPFSFVLALALPAGAFSQSMGEVAAKERERREKARAGKPAPKVITEEDLRSVNRPKGTISNMGAPEGSPEVAASPEAGASPAPGATPAPGAPAEKTGEELRADRQGDWRERLQRAQIDVQNLSARAEQLQIKVNDVSGNIYSASRANLVSELESTKTLLATARVTLANLEDEGRRNGYRQ
jgi:hypothetical protein